MMEYQNYIIYHNFKFIYFYLANLRILKPKYVFFFLTKNYVQLNLSFFLGIFFLWMLEYNWLIHPRKNLMLLYALVSLIVTTQLKIYWLVLDTVGLCFGGHDKWDWRHSRPWKWQIEIGFWCLYQFIAGELVIENKSKEGGGGLCCLWVESGILASHFWVSRRGYRPVALHFFHLDAILLGHGLTHSPNITQPFTS